MAEIDALDRSIDALQQLQRAAWLQLADRSITAIESRGLRSELKNTAKDLRHHHELKSQSVRRRVAR